MRELGEIVRDNEALINSRLADFEHRIAIAKMYGNLRTAKNIERQKEEYIRRRLSYRSITR